MRSCEQVRMNLGYMQSNVKIVSIGSGISMGYLGNSHFGLEDISIVRSIANIPIVCPADCLQLESVISFLSSFQGPAYVRLSGVAPCKPIYSEHPEFNLSIFDDLIGGSDVLILSYGSVLHECIEAHELLGSHSISARVINIPNPISLPVELLDIISQYQYTFVVEEHRLSGGLFTSVAEATSLSNSICDPSHRLIPITLPNLFIKSGNYPDLLAFYGLDSSSIANRIIKEIS